MTSANFTEAAQMRNIEAGVLILDPGFARSFIDNLKLFISALSTRNLGAAPN